MVMLLRSSPFGPSLAYPLRLLFSPLSFLSAPLALRLPFSVRFRSVLFLRILCAFCFSAQLPLRSFCFFICFKEKLEALAGSFALAAYNLFKTKYQYIASAHIHICTP